jgi:antitoxin component YwqK of YwqJK toxin-antitoxin module
MVKNGKYVEFNKHAILIAEGSYVKNLKHGRWKEYYDYTGAIMIEEYYERGVQHGRFVSYHPNGQVFSDGQFYDGKREGIFKIYDEDGNHVRSLIFINDKQVEHLIETPVMT